MDKTIEKKIIFGKQKIFTKKHSSYDTIRMLPSQRSVVMSSMHNNSTELIELSKTVGHVIISFTTIYCSLNWSLYRSIRKQIEKKRIRVINHIMINQKKRKKTMKRNKPNEV